MEEGAGCLAFIVFKRMSCYCKCSVALLHSAMGWSAVCDSVIFWWYSLVHQYRPIKFIETRKHAHRELECFLNFTQYKKAPLPIILPWTSHKTPAYEAFSMSSWQPENDSKTRKLMITFKLDSNLSRLWLVNSFSHFSQKLMALFEMFNF